MAVVAGDWRDAGMYDRLLPGDRRCFAWEWLRRTPAYRDAWASCGSPEPFGLERVEDPALDATQARPIWSADIDTAVVHATVRSQDVLASFFPEPSMPFMTTIASKAGVTPILLSDGLRSIRVDLHIGGARWVSPALTWHIDGITGIEAQLKSLAQLVAFRRLGRFSHTLHPPERRARRWIAMLRVHDALRAGATARDIVAELFHVPTADPRWRAAAAPWRLRVQRLAREARKCLMSGAAMWLDWSRGM